MSAQLPETPKPAEPPVNPAAKLSDKLITLFGGAMFVAGLIAGRLLKKDDPDAAEAWGDGLKGFGFVCAMVGGAISIPLLSRLAGAIGGKLLTALVIGGVLAAGGSVLPGCALLERREIHADTAPEVTYRVEDGRCVLRGFTDGHETYTAIGPLGEPCPAVTVRP